MVLLFYHVATLRLVFRFRRWGDSVVPLLEVGGPFDLVLMSDCLYELDHRLLLDACRQVLKKTGHVLVSFQVHDAVMREKVRIAAVLPTPLPFGNSKIRVLPVSLIIHRISSHFVSVCVVLR